MLARRLLIGPRSLPHRCARSSSGLTRHRYDVIVVGGGHAGTEAAAAAARVGADTLLITQKIQTIGALSCNPSLGGVGKGQLVREVDALDGLMGRAGDWAGVHFSILNRSKGPAVWGPRAQLDRERYRDFIQIMYMGAATDNKASTALHFFLHSVEKHGVPVRVRADQGCENVDIARWMFAVRGCDRGSFMAGKSVHNQRIERLWRDLWMSVTGLYYNMFHSLEEDGLLDPCDSRHLFAAHYVFLPRLQADLDSFRDAWDDHPLRTEQNLTPNQLWAMGRIQNPVDPPSNSSQAELLSMPRLTVVEGSVDQLLVCELDANKQGKHRVTGVRMAGMDTPVQCSSVVLTTGTFLSGSLFMGQTTSPGGRMGDAPSCAGLSHTLREVLGLTVGRLRTGTPPRIVKETVDLSLATVQPPDAQPTPFSYINTRTHCPPEEQLPCYLTHTTPGVEEVVRESLHLNCHIQEDAKGPRYCPSIESRVLRFPGRRHQVWLEPEGLTSDLLYPQGLSMTMPPDVQLRLLREIPALRRAEMRTPGYGVQYDFVCPTQLFPSLEVKRAQGLFLAGQINGTTGYEEAAAQGLWAGVNAGRSALSLPPLSLSRTESYIGVLIDDLISRGVTEPYRMFTSRAEFRTSLRPDNADLRLTPKGFEEAGCVSAERYAEALRVREGLDEGLAALRSVCMSSNRWRDTLAFTCISENRSTTLSAEDLLQYKDISFEMLASAIPEVFSPYLEFAQRLKIEVLYHSHCEKQKREMERIVEEESLRLPQDLDYLSLPISLSQEVREILDRVRPDTLGAATRLPGMTPAAIVHLLNYVTKAPRRGRNAAKGMDSGAKQTHKKENRGNTQSNDIAVLQ